jgi:hypothetical protein
MEMDQFIGHAILDMIKHNVSIEFCKYRKFGDKDCSSFSTNAEHKKPEFRLIYNNADPEEYFETIVHEYCHFLQWKYRVKLYEESYKALCKFNKWLKKDSKTLDIKHVRVIQAMEMECDKRAVKLIKKLDLPIDIPRYIQKSNSYILTYNYVYETRDFGLCGSCFDPKVVDLMPVTHLRKDQIVRGIKCHREILEGDDCAK